MTITYYEYGMNRLASGAEPAEAPEGAAMGRLAWYGAVLTIVLDRIAHAEYPYDEILRFDDRLCAFIGRVCREASGGAASPELLDELAALREEYLEYIGLLEDNDHYRCGELHVLGERYFTRLARIGEIIRALSVGEAEWAASAEALAAAHRHAGEVLTTMALRQFYGAVRAQRYVPLASVCLAGDFFGTTAHLIRLFTSADGERPEVIEARRDALSRTYPLGPLVSFGGAKFDFRFFDDEDSPLMPEVVDMLGLE